MSLPQISLRSGNKDHANQWMIVPVDTPQVTQQINVNAKRMSFVDRSQRNDFRTYPVINLQISDPKMLKELLKGQNLDMKEADSPGSGPTQQDKGQETKP